MVDQRMQSFRIFSFVRPPVAERRPVIATAMKPAVVQYEAFHANCCACAGQRLQVGQIMIEVHRFPGIQMDRPRCHGAIRPPGQVLPDIAMEIMRQPVQSIRAETEIGGRCDVRFTCCQHHFTRRQPFAQLQLAAAIRGRFDQQGMIAAPSQMRAPDRPAAVVQIVADNHAGETVVRSAATPVVAAPGADAQGLPGFLKFQRITAGKCDDLVSLDR
jgi:hypothetical protein